MRAFLAITAVTLLFGAPTMAAPFGVEMGTPIANLRVLSQKGSVYTVMAPNPNSEFESYMVIATAKTGVCKINGIGVDHTGDAEGSEIRGVFDKFKTILSTRYGTSKYYDFLHANSIWSNNTEFAMSLRQNQRTLADIWDAEEHSALAPDIDSIMLEAHATNTTTTYITVSYEFKNFKQCKSIVETSEAGSL